MAQLKNTTVDGTLNVSGNSHLAATTVDLNLGVNGTCSISGTTSLQGLTVNGSSTFNSSPIFSTMSGSSTSMLKAYSTGELAKATANSDYLGPVTAGTWTPTLRGLTTTGSWSYTT